MTSLSISRSTPLLSLLLGLASGCTHTDSFPAENFGAIGPLHPGPEARLTGFADATWSEDGGGILYAGACLTRSAVPHGYVPSLIVLPAAGGSAILDLCEQPLSLANPTAIDSAVWLLSPALGADGRLIYMEVISNSTFKPIPCSCIAFPVASHAELWLSDSTAPFTRRHKLLTLYHDTLGRPTVPDDQVNWLVDIAWSGRNTFVALGQNVRPGEVGRTAGPLLAMVRGIIDTAGASLVTITGTDSARMFSLAEANGTILFNREAMVIERVPVEGGTPTIAAVIPPLPGRSLRDISCQGESCLILTQEPGATGSAQSTFWTLTLNNGSLTPLRSYPTAISRAKVSPSSKSVIVVQHGGLYLFTDLLP